MEAISQFVRDIIENAQAEIAAEIAVEAYVPRGVSSKGMENLVALAKKVRAAINKVETTVVNREDTFIEGREIIDGIWLGSINCLHYERYIGPMQPQTVITVCNLDVDEDFYRKQLTRRNITHHYFPMEDNEIGFWENMWLFPEIMKVFCEAIGQGRRVFIHCQVGISRSPAVLALFFAKLSGKSFPLAHKFIRSIHVDTHEIYERAPAWFGPKTGQPNFPYLMSQYCAAV